MESEKRFSFSHHHKLFQILFLFKKMINFKCKNFSRATTKNNNEQYTRESNANAVNNFMSIKLHLKCSYLFLVFLVCFQHKKEKKMRRRIATIACDKQIYPKIYIKAK